MLENEEEGRTTKDRFHLTCKVLKRKLSYREHQSWGKEWNEQAEVVLLQPLSSTEADCFFSAWLPEKLTPEEIATLPDYKPYSELVMEAGNPVCGYFRGAVQWGTNLFDSPHIFVMTKRAEERLMASVGKTIQLTCLGDGEEESLYELKHETRSPYASMK